MCGITAIINKRNIASGWLQKSNETVSHRGPDDEGFLLTRPNGSIQLFAGNDTADSTYAAFNHSPLDASDTQWQVGLGHRRLSIIDLSPAGHQPMVLEKEGLAITYNGEVYNYIELRNELLLLGRKFHTSSDTEVILQAWAQWGKESLHKLNGMFAFVLLDSNKQKLYAVRDRFGVKPMYYTEQPSYVAFASEVKQLRCLPEYQFQLNEKIAFEYLRTSLLDHDAETFENGIKQLMPGCLIDFNLSTGDFSIEKWYTLKPTSWEGTFEDACTEFRRLLKDSVRLRLRSDVPVGSALSGGLDSSTIVCLMREILEEQGFGDHTLKTITSCQTDKRFDEWDFAERIVQKVKAESHRVFPSFEKLQHDLNRFIWHMDYPFGSTSQFSQWCVFEGAKQQGLTVMIDGQGADEQLAGYGGNDLALYTGLLGRYKLATLVKEINAFKKNKGQWPTGFVLGAIQHHLPATLVQKIPDKYLVRKNHPPAWLKDQTGEKENWPGSLQQSLFQQVTRLPLPSLLRYEDRNSMAFSIESRVPFMDFRLIEFTLGLPEEFVYYQGERKRILRKSFRGTVPHEILDRKDKMGFLSAEERWLKEEGKTWFKAGIDLAAREQPDLFIKDLISQMIDKMQGGSIPFNFDPWRIICLNTWYKSLAGTNH